MDHLSFASFLTSYSSLIPSTSVRPPLWSKGSLCHILPIALKYIQSLSQHADPKDQDEFTKKVIAFIAYDRRISHIPWSAPTQAVDQRLNGRLVYNSWKTLSTAKQFMSQPFCNSNKPPPTPPLSPAKLSAKRALLNNINGKWDASMLKITDLHTILHKKTLPSDWTLDSVKFGEDAYVKETYMWVERYADLENPVHQIALLAGIIFSKVFPQIGYPENAADILRASSSTKISPRIHQVEWTLPKCRSRTSYDPSTLMVMLATYVIALTESRFPLAIHANRNGGALGGAWTKLHSESIIFKSITISLIHLWAALRGITPFNLVRMGFS
jgi:hypothetical protein